VSARSRRRRAVALLREFEEGCATPPARLRQVVDAMVVEMHAGLASDGGSKLKMLLLFPSCFLASLLMWSEAHFPLPLRIQLMLFPSSLLSVCLF
jgi:hypothetical protein